AILKCLGATKKQTFLIYLLQIGFVGLASGVIGTFIGLFLQQLFPLILEGLLPVEVEISLVPSAIYSGILLGIFMSVLFALYPLIGTIYISPLQALRIEEGTNSKSTKAGLLVLGAIFYFIFLFAFWFLNDFFFLLYFLVVIIISFLILGGIAHGFMK